MKKKTLDHVSRFPRHYFWAAAASHCFTTEQSFEASFFVNATHLILKGGDSRLKLLSFEIFVVLDQIGANFHQFTSYLLSAVVLRNETHQMMKWKIFRYCLQFLIGPFFLKTSDRRQTLYRRCLTERSKRINFCSLECDLTKHPLSLELLKVDGSQMVL